MHQYKIFFLTTLASWISREKSDVIEYLMTVNDVLKKKIEVDGKRIRFTDAERARLARKGRRLSWQSLCKFSSVLTPETIIRWHNRLIAKKYAPKNHNPSKAKITRERIVKIVCEMAQDNINWGAGKIVGALKHLGIRRSKATVSRIMKSHGFDPLPSGGHTKVNASWLKFIKTHLNLMSSGDFFTQEVWTMRGLVRYLVFFVVDCKTRKVNIVHISHSFCGDTMTRLALRMTDCFDGILKGKKFFFCDKDVLYTQKFRRILGDSGVKIKQVPSPVCNPYAERFVKSIKNECLDHLIFFGEGMLRKAVKEYEEYYNTERPHQSLGDELVEPDGNKYKSYLDLTKSSNTLESLYKSGKDEQLIVKSRRLGGLLNFYYRKCG